MFLRYIGNRYPGGVGDDYEHQKVYWGPENNWICEVPDMLGVAILESKGPEQYEVIPKPTAEELKPEPAPKPEVPKPKSKPKAKPAPKAKAKPKAKLGKKKTKR